MSVRSGFIVCVARDAGEDCVIRRIRMAVSTGGPLAQMRAGVDGEPCVVKRRAGPGGGVVAGRASGWECRSHVVGIGGGCENSLVARVTIRRRAGVASAHVAIRASHRGMRSGQREHGLAVVKNRRHPGRGVVAYLAIRGEPAGDMVRSGCLLELRQVARNARGAQPHEHSAGVAVAASQRGVETGEREQRLGVVKRRVEPRCRAVADRTIRGKSGGHVVGIGGGLKRTAVARIASRRRGGKRACGMALGTGKTNMRPGQRELGHGGVVER